MNLYQAETGKKIILNNIPIKENILSLKNLLSSTLNVPVNNIIFLSRGGSKLDENSPVQNHVNEDIFVFDRKSFGSGNFKLESPRKPFEIEVLPFDQMKYPFTEKDSITENYLKRFYYHVHISENFVDTCHKRIKYIVDSLNEQRIQSEAILCAISNLNGHFDNISQGFDNFKERYESQLQHFENLSNSFDDDIKKLQEKELHFLLQRENRKYLIDFIPVNQLRLWVPKCMKELELFKTRVDRANESIEKLTNDVMKERNTNPISSLKFQILEGYENKANEIKKKEESLVEEFKKDYNALSEMIKTSKSEFNENSLKMKIQNHNENLTIFRQCDEKLKELMTQIDVSKNNLKEIFYEKLKTISEKESKITKLGKKLLTFVSILNTLGNNFQHIEMIHCLDAAYSLSLLEISRRRKFHQNFMNEIKKNNSNLKRLESEELNLRKKFTRNVGKYLPSSLIPGFNDPIQKFEIEVLESTLPRIESSKKYLDVNQVEKLFKNSFEEKDLQIYDEIEEDENDHFNQIQEDLNFNLYTSSFIKNSKEEEEFKQSRIELEKFKEENEKLKIEIENTKKKAQELENEFANQKSLVDSTLNEIVDRHNESDELLKENQRLRDKIEQLEKEKLSTFNENETISQLLKEKEDLKSTVKVKEKLRHETALNCAHSEKKLFSMTKDFQKSTKQLKSYQEKFTRISKICNINLPSTSKIDDLSNSIELENIIEKIREMNQKRIEDGEILNELKSQPFDVKLSLKNFQKDCYCIFIQNSKGYFEAINDSTPFYFLSDGTIRAMENVKKTNSISKYIIGKIYKIENKVASKDRNPYQLTEGTKYFVVDVEISK
eukprot:gene5006-8604_t